METNKLEQIEILTKGNLDLEGQFLFGSNYSFLVTLKLNGRQLKAIYKPKKGEMPLWDFPPESLADREAAAYLISEALGWNLVPPTVIRRKAAFGKGSLQLFIPHDPEQNYFTFNKEILSRLRPTVLFDLVVNNADRKGSHILLDEQQALHLIDHGLCFHTDPKIRTVIWNFAGQPIPEQLLLDIERLHQVLSDRGFIYRGMQKHLKEVEIKSISLRIQQILGHPVFPNPDPERRPFPWPLV